VREALTACHSSEDPCNQLSENRLDSFGREKLAAPLS